VNRGSGESVNCKNRESDAEDSLAFHEGVLRGVVVGSGADVTPRIFYENFIAVMVNIDGNDRKDEAPHTSLMVPFNDSRAPANKLAPQPDPQHEQRGG
jgi:hypothetical protein